MVSELFDAAEWMPAPGAEAFTERAVRRGCEVQAVGVEREIVLCRDAVDAAVFEARGELREGDRITLEWDNERIRFEGSEGWRHLVRLVGS